MQHHIWSQEDYALLGENVRKYGLTSGFEKTATQIGSTYNSCSTKYYKHVYTTTTTAEPLESKVFKEPRTRHHVSTDEEVAIANYLREEIAKNPHNLKVVFKKCAEHFGFSSDRAISARWYGFKYKNTDYTTRPSYKNNIGVTYALVGNSVIINGKNTKESTVKKTGWILTILRKLLNKK